MLFPRQPSRSCRHGSHHAAARKASSRRLRFERCEERLPLSGTSAVEVAPSQTEGGYLAFDSGNFLRTLASDFISSDEVNFAFSYLLPQVVDAPTPALDVPNHSAGLGVGNVPSDGLNVSNGIVETGNRHTAANELPDGITTGPISPPDATTAGFSGLALRMAISQNAVAEVATNRLELMYTDLQETLQTMRDTPIEIVEHDALTEADPSRSQTSFTTFDESSSLQGRMMPVIAGTHQRFEWSLEHGTVLTDQPTEITEGGAIDVAVAVAQTQRAYESELFSAVAMVLDEQGVLDEPALPMQQPLASELARPVAFELASFEQASSLVPLDDAFEPDVNATVVPKADVPLSRVDEETESEGARALAFAQWPLALPASAGAMIVAWRRRAQARVDQQPPRPIQKTDSL